MEFGLEALGLPRFTPVCCQILLFFVPYMLNVGSSVKVSETEDKYALICKPHSQVSCYT